MINLKTVQSKMKTRHSIPCMPQQLTLSFFNYIIELIEHSELSEVNNLNLRFINFLY